MSGFGEKLKREREAQRTSLEEISAATKISVRLLQAIETENFDRLPGGIFNVNFVRQYARHLHLDEEQVVGEFRALTTPPSDSQPEESKPMLPLEWSRMETGYDSGISREPQLWKWATLAIAMLGVASAGYLWFLDRQSQRAAETTSVGRPATETKPVAAPPAVTPPVATPQVDTPAEPGEQPPVPADGTPGAAPALQAEPLAATPAAASAAPTSAPADAPVRVELHAIEVVWVSASADGTPRFQATLQPEQTRSVSAQSMVRLRVGNAGGLTVTLNGAAQPAIGPKGQVRTVVFTANGMQVLTPAPASESPTGRGAAGAQASAGQ
jgi:cytoskeleton protein RodZ